jgi:hypothetical protein
LKTAQKNFFSAALQGARGTAAQMAARQQIVPKYVGLPATVAGVTFGTCHGLRKRVPSGFCGKKE